MAPIELRGIEKSLGGRRVLSGVSLAVEAGQAACVVGRSGAGKSVLTRIAIGLLPPDRGEVFLLGRRIDGLARRELRAARRGVGLVTQGAALLGWLSLRENVALPLGDGFSRRAALERADAALAEVGAGAEGARRPAEVSAGTRQRAAVARALALAPRAVLYDEPTTGLDPAASRQIDALIRRSADRGAAVLVVTHDPILVRRVADRVLELRDGVLHDRPVVV